MRKLLTDGLNTEEIIALAAVRWEFPWQWGIRVHNEKMTQAAADLGVQLLYGEPIRPGDMYLAMRNTGPHLLECKWLGEACIHATTPAYPFDFSECVLVKPLPA